MQHLVEEEQHERDGVSKNNNGDTPLMLAAGEGHEEVVHCIVSRFSRCIDWRNKVGVTAMMHAAKNGCDAVVNVSGSMDFFFLKAIYICGVADRQLIKYNIDATGFGR